MTVLSLTRPYPSNIPLSRPEAEGNPERLQVGKLGLYRLMLMHTLSATLEFTLVGGLYSVAQTRLGGSQEVILSP